MQIKRISSNDTELIKLLDNTFINEFPTLKLKERFTSNPFTNFFYIEKSGNICGFIDYDVIYDRAELVDIYVLEEYRNLGIASMLMEKMLEELSKIDICNVTLEVREDNVFAIKLYKKYGFVEVAVRKSYYGDKDGILMEKEMK